MTATSLHKAPWQHTYGVVINTNTLAEVLLVLPLQRIDRCCCCYCSSRCCCTTPAGFAPCFVATSCLPLHSQAQESYPCCCPAAQHADASAPPDIATAMLLPLLLIMMLMPD
jgi:hypothetical protein